MIARQVARGVGVVFLERGNINVEKEYIIT
jgi:hypothetical protein